MFLACHHYFEYKGFDLNLYFQGQTNAWTYDGNLESFARTNLDNNTVFRSTNRWTVDNQVGATMPRADSYQPGATDFFLYDATFIRIKTLEFGYNLGSELSRKIGLDNIRLFVSGSNLLTWAKEISRLGGHVLQDVRHGPVPPDQGRQHGRVRRDDRYDSGAQLRAHGGRRFRRALRSWPRHGLSIEGRGEWRSGRLLDSRRGEAAQSRLRSRASRSRNAAPNEIANDLADLYIAQFGQQRGELIPIRRAPAKRQKLWHEKGVVPRGIDRETVEALHRTHIGDDQDPVHLLQHAVRDGVGRRLGRFDDRHRCGRHRLWHTGARSWGRPTSAC